MPTGSDDDRSGRRTGSHGRTGKMTNDANNHTDIRPLGPASKIAYSRIENIEGRIENEAARIYRTDQHVGGMASCGAVTAVADVGVAEFK